MKRLAISLFAALSLVGCGGDTQSDISRDKFGESWPFTVDRGNLYCVNGNQVVFASSGGLYAVNGAAINSGKYQSLDPIWVNNPSTGAKKSLSEIIEKGLQLCK